MPDGHGPTDDDQALTCMCGCGEPARNRFKPGHDRRLYGKLEVAERQGDSEAAELYDFLKGNDDFMTFPEQRRRVRHWLDNR